jgi:hypothetical protein
VTGRHDRLACRNEFRIDGRREALLRTHTSMLQHYHDYTH